MNSSASEETVVLMPELWDLVFNWVGVTEGLANVGRVNHAFRDIVRRQFERRRQNFATRRAPLSVAFLLTTLNYIERYINMLGGGYSGRRTSAVEARRVHRLGSS
jgi:hypothetical protein